MRCRCGFESRNAYASGASGTILTLMCRMTSMDRCQLKLGMLAYFISCSTGLLWKQTFNGILEPMDPDVCTTQNITFTSTLLDHPKLNYSIGFAVKNRSTDRKYVAVEHDRVTKINETVSEFTIYNISLATEIFYLSYFYVKSFYWQEYGDSDSRLQLGHTTSTRVYRKCNCSFYISVLLSASFVHCDAQTDFPEQCQYYWLGTVSGQDQFPDTCNIRFISLLFILSFHLDRLTAARVYPLPEEVQHFKCIVFNYVSMRCSWKYGKDYGNGENMPEVIFQWSLDGYNRSFIDCKDLNSEDGYCDWEDWTAGYFLNEKITVRLILIQPCGINASSEFHIDTAKIVKPNPVFGVFPKVINSTCIQLSWDTSDSEQQYPKEHRVIVSSEGVNVTKMRFSTTKDTEKYLHKNTFCNLNPYTNYTFSVSIRPTGPYSGYFSDPRSIVSRTYSNVPRRMPQNVIVSVGSKDNTLVVTWDKLICQLDEPYIAEYRVQYKKQDGSSHKSLNKTESFEARAVLMDLEEDQIYVVTVRGVTSDGLEGPESQPKTGIPVNKSLKSVEITGISIAVLVSVIFSGVGIFCAVRKCKIKAQEVIKQAGYITIPDAPDQDMYSSRERRNSNDSECYATRTFARSRNGIELSSQTSLLQYDYDGSPVVNGEQEGTATARYAFEPELTRLISDRTDTSGPQAELFCGTSQTTRESTIKLPKNVEYSKKVVSDISLSGKVNPVTMDSFKDRNIDHIMHKKTKGIHLIDVNETKVTPCDSKVTRRLHESHLAKPYTLFPLSNTPSTINSPFPNESTESSIGVEAECPFAHVERNCQQCMVIPSSTVVSHYKYCLTERSNSVSESPVSSTTNNLHESKNIKGSSYVTTTDATHLFLERSRVSIKFMRVQSVTSGNADAFSCSKQSKFPDTYPENAITFHSKSAITQNPDIFVEDERSMKVPGSNSIEPLLLTLSPTALHKTSDSPQNVSGRHDQYFTRTSLGAHTTVIENTILSNKSQQFVHFCSNQTSSRAAQNQDAMSVFTFEHGTSSNIVRNSKSTNCYIPQSNAVQAFDSIKINGYVPHANTISDFVPCCDLACIPNGVMGNFSGHESSSSDSKLTPINCASNKTVDPGYVFSTEVNDSCQ
ncbi:uncharacterized protein LOC123536162 isoform X3 [Mercenaria mercenaria]|uniref:uncharacterized protein LOC123536162 isoform X3 n=2 Tax=Mercenaria mercenaria TaxID=6596 RepID=UPI00234FA9F1|nr:uncharacterized protein LOC123536162 isoform X3 [Mercenaria mercenaria]